VGVAVANADNGMTAIKVHVFLTFIVPYFASFSLHDIHIEKGVNVK
jgi:hypothetical protein